MSYNVLDISMDPLPEHLKSSSPQAAVEWLRDLPVFEGIPLKVRLHIKNPIPYSFEFTVEKESNDDLKFTSDFFNSPIKLHLASMDENSEDMYLDGTNMSEKESWTVRGLIDTLARSMQYADHNRQYPFQVIDNSKKKSKGKKSKKKEKATIVYLDRPPQGSRDKSGTGQPLEFGYPRRSHRRTLTHPRFKNHPKYKVYKGVRVKQTWCGPKEFRDRQRIYRLIEMQDE